MFVWFYYDGGGGRSTLLSIGITLGMVVLNYVLNQAPLTLRDYAPLATVSGVVVGAGALATMSSHDGGLWRRVRRFFGSSDAATPARFDAVLDKLRTMPMEKWKPAKDLSVHELRRRLRSGRGDHFLERHELEKAYDDSFEDVCAICAEPWVAGDVYRRLDRCGHCFHVDARLDVPVKTRRVVDSEAVAKRRRRTRSWVVWSAMKKLAWCCCWCCLGWVRRRRRRKDTDEAVGDIEMGGGRSKLVSERVRMLEQQDVPESPPPPRPAEKRQMGATILERRAMLERQTSEPSREERRPATGAGLERLRTQSGKKKCAACGLDAFATEGESARGAWYHKSCLRCGACGRSLVGVPFGRLADDDDVLYCDESVQSRSGRSCLARLRDAGAHADAEREAENQRLTETDRESVGLAKTRAVDLIGDDLDKIVQQMAPTCAACGRRFHPKDELVMQGMVKFHEACLYGGSGPPRQVSLSPKKALDDAPSDLLFKIKPKADAAAKVMTFFASRRALAASTVTYEPDVASRAPKHRKVDPAALVGAVVRAIGTSGRDLAPETYATFADCATLGADFAWTAASLDWSIRADFRFNPADSTIAFTAATLTVAVVVEGDAPQRAALTPSPPPRDLAMRPDTDLV
ncbi:hypothetical protein CTAYLR_000208 [Chrysophaeum taylorii]|uniref:LIM zinc-binding domain-containing protein n=1 Tax=Chrysophaeum taylorii TaxID=2483200 RepID=A0AAD7XM30_9STRA|nr:hypothetical protein CTAYLR_000208 [Chrysophaeum taylorii]